MSSPRRPCNESNWTSYKINQSTDKVGVFVSIVSTRIPYKGAGKEYIGRQSHTSAHTVTAVHASSNTHQARHSAECWVPVQPTTWTSWSQRSDTPFRRAASRYIVARRLLKVERHLCSHLAWQLSAQSVFRLANRMSVHLPCSSRSRSPRGLLPKSNSSGEKTCSGISTVQLQQSSRCCNIWRTPSPRAQSADSCRFALL